MYCPFSYKNCSKKNQKIFADLGKLPRVDVLLSKNDLNKKVMDVFDVRNSVNSKTSYGGTSTKNIKKMISRLNKEFK